MGRLAASLNVPTAWLGELPGNVVERLKIVDDAFNQIVLEDSE